MESEKFCLKWNDFEINLSSAFRYLRDDKDFFDVTLVCEDEQIQAHKVILSACSPFFHKVLSRNPHQHPLLFMKGITCSDIKSVLDFMYHGEVNVAQEELNSFLAVAEDLKVKGLTQTQPVDKDIPKQRIGTTIKTHREELDKVQQPPLLHHHSHASTRHVEDDQVQQVQPIKTEPRESQAESSQEVIAYSRPAMLNQSVTTNQEEEERYEDYGEEQHYMEESMVSAGAGIFVKMNPIL